MTKPNVRAELAALRVAALEDILNTPDAELHREAVEDGEDPAAIAAGVKSAMRDAAAAALRKQLAEAKQRMGSAATPRPRSGVRPALEVLKKRVQEVFGRNPSLGLAFRDGKRQSAADWESLYDDLVALGEIDADPHGI